MGAEGELDQVSKEDLDDCSTTHYFTVRGLQRGTDHTCRIFATDESNNTGLSDTFTVGTFPIGWQERLWINYGRFIVTVVVLSVLMVTIALYYRTRWHGPFRWGRKGFHR